MVIPPFDQQLKLLQTHRFGEPCFCVGFGVSPFDVFCAGFADETIKLWNTADIEKLDSPFLVKGEQSLAAVSLAFSRDASKLAVCNMDNSVKIYAMDSAYSLYSSISPSTAPSWKVDFHPDGRTLACGTTSLAIINVEDGKKVNESAINSRFIHCLRHTKDGQLIAAGNIDGGVSFFETKNYQKVSKLEDHGLPVRDLVFTRDGETMLSVSDDMHINATSLSKMQRFLSLSGHTDWITAISLHPVLDLFATCSADKTIKLWDWKSKKAVQTMTTHDDLVWSLAFSADGKYLISGGESGLISAHIFCQLTASLIFFSSFR